MARKKFKANRKSSVSESKEAISGVADAHVEAGSAEGRSVQSSSTVIQEGVSKSPAQSTTAKPCIYRRFDMTFINFLLLLLLVTWAIWSLTVTNHKPETTINMTYSVSQTCANPTNPTLG